MKELCVQFLAGLMRQLPRLAVAAIAFALCTAALWELAPPGWDEATHAGFPAVELWDRLRQGEIAASAHALLRLEQYPPCFALMLGGLFLVTGPSVVAARALSAALFALLSVFAAALADHAAGSRETTRAGWATQGLVLYSPLFVVHSRTLFLEIPFAAICVLGVLLYVKLERRELEHLPPGRPRTELIYLLPGVLFAAACFTKWNYGLVLAALVILERLLSLALRRGERARSARISAVLLAPLALALAWWFLLPLPGDPAVVGAAHRAAFWSYLLEQRPRGLAPRAWALYGAWFCHLSPFVLGGVVLLAPLALGYLRHSGMRFLFLLALGFLGAVALHPFKLGRFLIPGLPFLWIAAGCGFHLITRRASRPARAYLVLSLALVALLSAGPLALTPRRFGLGAVSAGVLRRWRDPYSSRWVPAAASPALVELARRIEVELAPRGELRVVRTGHELPEATLLWYLVLAELDRDRPLDSTLARVAREDQLDVARLGRLPPWWEGGGRAGGLREFLRDCDLLVLLDPGYAQGRSFRLEAPQSRAIHDALLAQVSADPAFEPAGEPFELAFSARQPRVRIRFFRRTSPAR